MKAERAWLLGIIMTTLLCVRPAQAQLPVFDVSLTARAGLFTPLSALAEDASGRETKLASGLALGASVEIDIPLSPINVRASVDAALNRALQVEGQDVAGAEADVVAITGDLVFRPLPRIVVIQPYLLAGAGIKKYSTDNAFDSGSDFTGHLGIGADLRAGGIMLVGEVSDYISSFDLSGESRLQNDVFVTLGLRIGLL